MELKPKFGIDNLKFGMSQKEVSDILGQPDRIFQLDDFGDNEMVWEWNEKFLRLTFYHEENNRFGYLRTMHPDLTYNGQKILNLPPEVVKEKLFPELIQWDKNEFDFLTMYFNEKYWLNLNCEYGLVLDLEMGVPFKNDEDYDWPI
ncbi:hypothetical protein GTQ38_13950 [Flavobacteriaceae bacterium R33]|uniref:Uncharacterized protein n=2 Tax=Poritiphilus flavus TaxID=2697053 RepID=A0A6L9EEC6_9FLAO|nr:hypothetical protein [Poritiphilus flavus]